MVHSAFFNYFKECLPDIAKKVETYFSNKTTKQIEIYIYRPIPCRHERRKEVWMK